jgi:hypothetical protein
MRLLLLFILVVTGYAKKDDEELVVEQHSLLRRKAKEFGDTVTRQLQGLDFLFPNLPDPCEILEAQFNGTVTCECVIDPLLTMSASFTCTYPEQICTSQISDLLPTECDPEVDEDCEEGTNGEDDSSSDSKDDGHRHRSLRDNGGGDDNGGEDDGGGIEFEICGTPQYTGSISIASLTLSNKICLPDVTINGNPSPWINERTPYCVEVAALPGNGTILPVTTGCRVQLGSLACVSCNPCKGGIEILLGAGDCSDVPFNSGGPSGILEPICSPFRFIGGFLGGLLPGGGGDGGGGDGGDGGDDGNGGFLSRIREFFSGLLPGDGLGGILPGDGLGGLIPFPPINAQVAAALADPNAKGSISARLGNLRNKILATLQQRAGDGGGGGEP